MQNEDTENLIEHIVATDAQMDEVLSTIQSWFTVNNKDFFFNYTAYNTLPSGLYSMVFSENNGFGLSSMDYRSEEIFILPSLPHKKIIKDLQDFWENKDKFIEYNLTPKRGIILHGEPGVGKTSMIYLIIEEIKNRGGISIYFDVPQNWVSVAKMIRKIEPERPILCIIEDIDLVIRKFGEDIFLNFLDGLNAIDNVVYVATTNNLNDIPERIKDRPSRFDKKYEVKKPTEQDRVLYFQNKLNDVDKKKYDIEQLAKDTKNFTMAHLKEVFISLYILNNPYDEVLKRLKTKKIVGGTFGFHNDSVDNDKY